MEQNINFDPSELDSLLFDEKTLLQSSSPKQDYDFLTEIYTPPDLMDSQFISSEESNNESSLSSPSSDEWLFDFPETVLSIPLKQETLLPQQTNSPIVISEVDSKSKTQSVAPLSNSNSSTVHCRKRPRLEEQEPKEENSSVILSRDQLLRFSSEQLTQYFKNLGKTRKFTSSEEKEIRRQRRLVKNRESAQNSRQKKKVLLEELERKIDVLESEKRTLHAEITKLRSENKNLQEELKSLKVSSATTGVKNISVVSKGKPKERSQAVVKGGTSLLIILFTFAIVFSAWNRQPENPFRSGPREEIPQVSSIYTNSPRIEEIRQARSRKLLQVEEPLPLEVDPQRIEENTSTQTIPSSNSTDYSTSLIPAMPSDLLTNQYASKWIQKRNQKYPNTAYFMASSLQQIIPPEDSSVEYSSNSPFVMSIFVPNHLEITCQVLQVRNITTYYA